MTFQGCFLPSFDSFGKAVSEKKIVPIRYQTWRPQTILVSDWLISQKSFSLKLLCQMNPNLVGSILGRSSIKCAHAFCIEDLPRMLPTKFRFIWTSGFRGEDFLEINQSETRIACGGHVC
jgi:hypothetical protein